MRTTVTIDDELYQTALEYLDPATPKSDVFRIALTAFVQFESAKRLIALGGTAPDMEDIPRSRYDWDDEEEDDDENNRNH